jgi:hypothetical protein
MELSRIQTPAGRKAFIYTQEGDDYKVTVVEGSKSTTLTFSDPKAARAHWVQAIKDHPTWHRLKRKAARPKHSNEDMVVIKEDMLFALSEGIRDAKPAWKYGFAKFYGESFDGSQYGIPSLNLVAKS